MTRIARTVGVERIALFAIVALLATPPLAAQTPGANAKPKSSSFEFRIGGVAMSAERNAEFFGDVSKATGTATGVDVLLRSRFVGLAARSFTTDFGTDRNVTSGDLALVIGGPVFSIHVGAGRRAIWSDLATNAVDVGIIGFSSNMRIGGTGFRGNITVLGFAPAGEEAQEKTYGGLEGESSLIYTLPKVPIFLQLGYRAGVFTGKATSASSGSAAAVETPEELRGLRLGAGLQFGGR